MKTQRLVQALPDPQGMISRIRARLPHNCGVRLSPFCDYIISMRMQGISYKKIEDWLTDKGPEHRLASCTIYKNLERAKMRVELPYAEELAERWGGNIDLDLARELAGQIVSQRRRVDNLVREEEKKQKTNSAYLDKRIKGERDSLESLIKTLHGMMKSPVEAAKDREEADKDAASKKIDATPDALDLITRLIIDGELKIGSTA